MASSDRERELTARGIDDLGFGTEQFLQLCEQRGLPQPTAILYSRWLRTSQTADIIGSRFTHARAQACDALVPGQRPADVDAMLQEQIQAQAHILLVSHQPLVSSLVDHYLGQPGRVAPLVPGGFACLQLDVAAAGCAQLLFSAQPPEYGAFA